MEECVYRSQMHLLPAKVNRSHNSGTEIVVKNQTCSKFQMLSLVDSDIHIVHHWDGSDINAITGYIVTLVVGYFYYW